MKITDISNDDLWRLIPRRDDSIDLPEGRFSLLEIMQSDINDGDKVVLAMKLLGTLGEDGIISFASSLYSCVDDHDKVAAKRISDQWDNYEFCQIQNLHFGPTIDAVIYQAMREVHTIYANIEESRKFVVQLFIDHLQSSQQ